MWVKVLYFGLIVSSQILEQNSQVHNNPCYTHTGPILYTNCPNVPWTMKYEGVNQWAMIIE